MTVSFTKILINIIIGMIILKKITKKCSIFIKIQKKSVYFLIFSV